MHRISKIASANSMFLGNNVPEMSFLGQRGNFGARGWTHVSSNNHASRGRLSAGGGRHAHVAAGERDKRCRFIISSKRKIVVAECGGAEREFGGSELRGRQSLVNWWRRPSESKRMAATDDNWAAPSRYRIFGLQL